MLLSSLPFACFSLIKPSLVSDTNCPAEGLGSVDLSQFFHNSPSCHLSLRSAQPALAKHCQGCPAPGDPPASMNSKTSLRAETQPPVPPIPVHASYLLSSGAQAPSPVHK